MADFIKLTNAIGGLRNHRNPIHLENVIDALNELMPSVECVDFMFTDNTDKIPFGVIVVPVLTPDNLNQILLSGVDIRLNKYYAEIDSKVFQYGLDDDEIAAILIYDIIRMCSDSTPVQRLRNAIDAYFTTSDTQLKIRDSIQYQQILALGLVDTLIKFTNCLYLDSYVTRDAYLDSIELGDEFVSGIAKLYKMIPGFENSASRMPMLVILDWCFRLYGDVEHERIPAIKQLERSKTITASALYKRVIDKAIDSLYKIDTDSLVFESYDATIVNESKKNSLFSQIKYNGLRGLEDDFYEFMIRARNAETEEDVMYALKQINVRLSILDDYIRNENLSDEDKKRWTDLYIKYRTIRDEIANKKIYNKRNYGVFFDYNKLDDTYGDDDE